MAITMCSSSSYSPNLPSVSLSTIPTKSSLKSPHCLHVPTSLSSTSPGPGLVSDDALTMAAAAEAVVLASAAALAARDAAASEFETGQTVCYRGTEDGLEKDWNRRKRRKRRKGLEYAETAVSRNGEFEHVTFSRKFKSGHLTPKEEAEYSRCLKEEARVEAARRAIVETSKQEPTTKQLAKAVGIGVSNLDKTLCSGRESRERITCSYRRLVVSIATCFQGRGLSLQDLIQEGSIGLLRGAQRFNPEKGYKMSTYVYWWIRQAITRAISNKSRLVRLPGSMCEKIPKVAEANSMLSRRLHRLPSHDEVAEAVNMDVSTLRLLHERNRLPISLDQAVTCRGCMTLQDIMPGPDETIPETMVKKQQVKQEVEKLLNMLCEREVDVLRLYYGLNGESPRSFEEIGRLLKLSRERVRQINYTALSKLRNTDMVDNLKVYLV